MTPLDVIDDVAYTTRPIAVVELSDGSASIAVGRITDPDESFVTMVASEVMAPGAARLLAQALLRAADVADGL